MLSSLQGSLLFTHLILCFVLQGDKGVIGPQGEQGKVGEEVPSFPRISLIM